MNDNNLGKRCPFSDQCPVFNGLSPMNQPLFLVRNIYCNNGARWWGKCDVFQIFDKGGNISVNVLPNEDLKNE